MLGLMMNDITLHSSLYLDSELMKKLLVLFLLLGTLYHPQKLVFLQKVFAEKDVKQMVR